MSAGARLRSVHPVIPARDMDEAIAFYVGKLGFTKAFDNSDGSGGPISYAGVTRDGVCLHLQRTAPDEDDPAMPQLRIRVEHVDALHAEYEAQGVVASSGKLRNTSWGTREFGVYDPNNAALVFYEDV